jgi:hypothetical protein
MALLSLIKSEDRVTANVPIVLNIFRGIRFIKLILPATGFVLVNGKVFSDRNQLLLTGPTEYKFFLLYT